MGWDTLEELSHTKLPSHEEDLDFYKFSSRESLPKTHPLHHP